MRKNNSKKKKGAKNKELIGAVIPALGAPLPPSCLAPKAKCVLSFSLHMHHSTSKVRELLLQPGSVLETRKHQEQCLFTFLFPMSNTMLNTTCLSISTKGKTSKFC